MMVSFKYSNHPHPFISFFKSCVQLLGFSSVRFAWKNKNSSTMNRPQLRTSCCIEECRLCVDLCPSKAVRKESNSVLVSQVSCVECELCIKRCPESFISRQ